MALPSVECFRGTVDFYDQAAFIYEALYGLATDTTDLVNPECFRALDQREMITQIYAALLQISGGGGTPGGADGDVQFNDGGAFGGEAAFNYDSATNALTVGGPMTATGQLIGGGTTTNDNAAAGVIGEYVTSAVESGGIVPLVNGVDTNITSIALTAGDWEVWGNVRFSFVAVDLTGSLSAGVSSTTGALPGNSYTGTFFSLEAGASSEVSQWAPRRRFSLAAPTTIFLVASANWSDPGGGTMGGYGNINARRLR